MSNLTRTADHLSAELEKQGFVIMSKTNGEGLPLVAFRLGEDPDREFDEFALARTLRTRGWVVPAYTMAPKTNNLKMLRIVVREDFSRSKCELLLADVKLCVGLLKEMDKESLERQQTYVQRHVMSSSKAQQQNSDAYKVRHQKKMILPRKSRLSTDSMQDETHSLQGKTGKTHAVC
jgi:glutamate decarboxylase